MLFMMGNQFFSSKKDQINDGIIHGLWQNIEIITTLAMSFKNLPRLWSILL
jgi:hypothetical protein